MEILMVIAVLTVFITAFYMWARAVHHGHIAVIYYLKARYLFEEAQKRKRFYRKRLEHVTAQYLLMQQIYKEDSTDNAATPEGYEDQIT